MVGVRPFDWSPLTGGDPCPGSPEAYASVAEHWGTRAGDATVAAGKLGTIVTNDAESLRVWRIEKVASEGKAVLEEMSRTFTTAQELLLGWKQDLEGMQERADEALRKAKAAEQLAVDARQEIGALGAFAAQVKENEEPNIARKIFLEEELSAARTRIAEAQRVVDEVRSEYGTKSADAVAKYQLAVAGLWSVDAGSAGGGLFGSSMQSIRDILVGGLSEQQMRDLEQAAAHAGDGPAEYEAYLKLLSDLDARSLEEFFGTHPDLARNPLASTGDVVWETTYTRQWWENLPDNFKEALTTYAPGLVSNLNGVSYKERDKASRKLIDDLLADPDISQEHKDDLQEIKKAAEGKKGEERYILFLDISHMGDKDGTRENDFLTAIAVGDVDEATSTTVMVPGMDNNVGRSINSLVINARDMYVTQDGIKKKDERVAVIAYLGYDTPDLGATADHYMKNSNRYPDQSWGAAPYMDYSSVPFTERDTPDYPEQSVLSGDLARKGGQQLADFYDALNVTKSSNRDISAFGLATTDEYNDPHISLNAHSYGTTTTAEALSLSQTAVNNVGFYGSAGPMQEAVDAANAGLWRIERNQNNQQELWYVHSPDDLLAPAGASAAGRPLPGEITFAQELQDIAVIDSNGTYYEDVDYHPVSTSGSQQGYWSPGAYTQYQGAQHSLGSHGNPSGARYLKAVYYVEEPRTGTKVQFTITSEMWNSASPEKKEKWLNILLQQQGMTREEFDAGKNK
ncbi:alpha/beta hydrolase [Rothia sp. CCM 9417]|uniref:alpha/beta hydrolase n=1 Tax=Rothia sp. CCM 9417 TaxID=3402657 RepID=UPI003ADA2698